MIYINIIQPPKKVVTGGLGWAGPFFLIIVDISILQVLQPCVPCIKYMLYYLRDSTYKIHILFPLEMVNLYRLLFMLTVIY